MDDDTLLLYVEESREHLADIENDLLAIEASAADIDDELVNKVFRAAHSIKGGAGFMGLATIKELSHKMENVLGMIRSRELVPNPDIINVLLMASDALRGLINNVERSNDIDVAVHIDALVRITEGSLPEEQRASVTNSLEICIPGKRLCLQVNEYDLVQAEKSGRYVYLIEYDLIHDVHRRDKNLLDLVKELQQGGSILESKLNIESVGGLDDLVLDGDMAAPMRLPFIVLFSSLLEPALISALVMDVDENYIFVVDPSLRITSLAEAIGLQSADKPEAKPETLAETAVPTKAFEATAAAQLQTPAPEPAKRPEPKPQTESRAAEQAETSLRVNIKLLDTLMNLAGELVLGRNQLLQAIGQRDMRAIEIASQRLDLITSEFQETIMLTRMQPIGNVFNKFPRVVRDLAQNLGKNVDLVLEGKDVELDKTIIEAISDPLTHLVRNAVDHGIETPDGRQRSGKNACGEIVLRAYHEAGQVNIEISDDGRGIDGDALVKKALQKQMITEEQARNLSEKDKVALIFMPGFSTAETVSDVSGRGVGMDVVKTNLDRLGGQVEVESVRGKGTRIHIRLPLTLAIIPSQIISNCGASYAIPQVNLEELVRIPADKVNERLERVGDAEVVRLRGKLLPLKRLADLLGTQRTYLNSDGQVAVDRRRSLADRRSGQVDKSGGDGDAERRASNDRRQNYPEAVNIMVVNTGTMQYGLVVDALHDSEEIVIKPLGRHFSHLKGYAGATLMGDGSVALILDVSGLAQIGGLTSVEGSARAAQVAVEHLRQSEDEQALLIFRSAASEQFCVPQGLVLRIEKIKAADIEEIGGQRVIQCRGVNLPLFSIDQVARVKPLEERSEYLAIVFMLAGKEVGLLATPPIDVITTRSKFDRGTLAQAGIMGSTIIAGQTTLMVDIFVIVDTLHPDWFNKLETVQTDANKAATILYAEDSNFFRTQVKNYLSDAGYNVLDAADGQLAWGLLNEHADEVNLVVTDIEMPNMNGLQLAERIRSEGRFANIPILALTTLASQEDIDKGKKAGITEYQVKLDREHLIESIYSHLKQSVVARS